MYHILNLFRPSHVCLRIDGFAPGTTLRQAFDAARSYARRNNAFLVSFTFNGKDCIATAGGSTKRGVSRFYDTSVEVASDRRS